MDRRAPSPVILLIAGALSVCQAVMAQTPPGPSHSSAAESPSFRLERAGAVPREAFGPGSQTTIIPVAAFVPGSGSYQYSNGNGYAITPSVDGQQQWFANLNLPSGAVVDTLDVFVVDNDPGSDITVNAEMVWFPVSGSGTCTSASVATGTSSGVTGQGHVIISAPWFGAINMGRNTCNSVDSYQAYEIAVSLETTNHSLAGARVVWYRVPSFAPATATFGDVPTDHPFFQFVEALVASGITAGCQASPPLYCPDAPLTRKQMAAFLVKALGLYWPQ